MRYNPTLVEKLKGCIKLYLHDIYFKIEVM